MRHSTRVDPAAIEPVFVSQDYYFWKPHPFILRRPSDCESADLSEASEASTGTFGRRANDETAARTPRNFLC
jgi:hypothetical protein